MRNNAWTTSAKSLARYRYASNNHVDAQILSAPKRVPCMWLVFVQLLRYYWRQYQSVFCFLSLFTWRPSEACGGLLTLINFQNIRVYVAFGISQLLQIQGIAIFPHLFLFIFSCSLRFLDLLFRNVIIPQTHHNNNCSDFHDSSSGKSSSQECWQASLVHIKVRAMPSSAQQKYTAEVPLHFGQNVSLVLDIVGSRVISLFWTIDPPSVFFAVPLTWLW